MLTNKAEIPRVMAAYNWQPVACPSPEFPFSRFLHGMCFQPVSSHPGPILQTADGESPLVEVELEEQVGSEFAPLAAAAGCQAVATGSGAALKAH